METALYPKDCKRPAALSLPALPHHSDPTSRSRLIPAPVDPLNSSRPTHPARTRLGQGCWAPPPAQQTTRTPLLTNRALLLPSLPILRCSLQPRREPGQSPAVSSQPTRSETRRKQSKSGQNLGANFGGSRGGQQG